MTCDSFARYLDLYLDGEMAAEERAEIETHIHACEGCRHTAAFETRFRSALRASMVGARAPGSLREQVLRRLREHSEDALRPRFTYAIAYAAAIGVVAIGGYAVVSGMLTRAARDMTGNAVAVHAASTDAEVYGDAARVASFLRDRAPFAFRVPFGDRSDMRLIGARLTTLGDVPAVVYMFDRGGKRLSVAQYPASEADRTPDLTVDQHSGYSVATWRDGNLVQTAVGDMAERDMPSMLPVKF